MDIKKFLQCALLSLGLVSAGDAMKYGSPFRLKVEAFLGGVSFLGLDVNFPSGNQMQEEDLYQQICNGSKKSYNDALKTGIADKDIYTQQFFNQSFTPWLQYFSKFVFYQGEDLNRVDQDDLKIIRSAISERNLKEACVIITGDHQNPARNKDIFLKIQVGQYN